MESSACDYEDWDDEDLHVLDEYEEQEILDGNPIFLKSTFSILYSSIPILQFSINFEIYSEVQFWGPSWMNITPSRQYSIPFCPFVKK